MLALANIPDMKQKSRGATVFDASGNPVGGVPVCLNNPVHDSYSGANFPAGPQTLVGVDALKFVRQVGQPAGGDKKR